MHGSHLFRRNKTGGQCETVSWEISDNKTQHKACARRFPQRLRAHSFERREYTHDVGSMALQYGYTKDIVVAITSL